MYLINSNSNINFSFSCNNYH